MTIKNTDGTPYKLKKFNPLLKTQDITTDLHTVHNFRVEEVTVKYRKKRLIQPVGAVIGAPEPLPVVKEQPRAPESEPEPEEQLPDPPAPIEEEGEDDYDPTTPNVLSCWCLPGQYKSVTDKLYGETRTSVAWGDKFLFEGIILDSSELNFQLWAQIEINQPSIIFIRDFKQWWQVNDCQPKDNGYVMFCMPSYHRPRFD